MKKILIIGNSKSIFIKDFCEQFANNNYIVDALSLDGLGEIQGARINKAIKKNTKGSFNRLGKIIFTQIELRRLLKKFDSDYDCIVIHFIDVRLIFVANDLTNRSKKIVAVFWGSDFYRTSWLRKQLQKIILKKSSAIVFTNPVTAENFRKGKIASNDIPLVVARFGLPALDEIKKIRGYQIPRLDMCKFFDLPSDKVLVFAGYNASLAHQQEVIINEFSKIDLIHREKSYIVFPLGYGNPLAEDVIQRLLAKHDIKNYKILNKFYGFHDIAKLRCITDVLINIQPSDQFSGSMQETLYAGGRVIAGAWLPYNEISQNGASIRYICSLDEVGAAIELEIKNGLSQNNFGPDSICKYIEKSSSWQENLKIWKNVMLDDVIEKANEFK